MAAMRRKKACKRLFGSNYVSKSFSESEGEGEGDKPKHHHKNHDVIHIRRPQRPRREVAVEIDRQRVVRGVVAAHADGDEAEDAHGRDDDVEAHHDGVEGAPALEVEEREDLEPVD